MRTCRRCPHSETRTQTVFAKGRPLSTLCFVGEAPGEEEDAQGIPFVGDSGKLLDNRSQRCVNTQRLRASPSPQTHTYVTCSSAGRRVTSCSRRQRHRSMQRAPVGTASRTAEPARVIVAVGKTSSRMLSTLRDENMNALRGRTFIVGGTKNLDVCADVKIHPVYHPAYLLRRRNDKALHAEAWADLKRVVEGLDEPRRYFRSALLAT